MPGKATPDPRKAGWKTRQEAVCELVDVLERLRPRVKAHMLKKDESDLFHIANKFGIRHHDASQKTDYDKAVWLSWMFYVYLATIHLVLRLEQQTKAKEGK